MNIKGYKIAKCDQSEFILEFCNFLRIFTTFGKRKALQNRVIGKRPNDSLEINSTP